jgi:hypothetical protein
MTRPRFKPGPPRWEASDYPLELWCGLTLALFFLICAVGLWVPRPLLIGKAIPVTGRGDPYGCETSRLPHFLNNRLTDGGEVVSLTRRPLFTPQEDSWYYLLEAESTTGHSVPGIIR